jgi:hypothetical protein
MVSGDIRGQQSADFADLFMILLTLKASKIFFCIDKRLGKLRNMKIWLKKFNETSV